MSTENNLDSFDKSKIANCSVEMCSNVVSPFLGYSVGHMCLCTKFLVLAILQIVLN